MDNSPQKLELNIKQSTALLQLGLEPVKGTTDTPRRNRSDVFLDILALKLPVNLALFESLPEILKPLSNELETVSGLPLDKLLQDPQTNIEILKSIKDYAKQLGTTASDDIERDAAFAVYMAAIATALVFHNVKISQYSYRHLEQSFEKLCKNDWLSSELYGLFQKAIDYCSSKKC
jgi:hypothetical protein